MGKSFERAAGLTGTRGEAVPITSDIDIAAVWPEVSRRLGAYLRGRGASRVDVEDAVQECALRLLAGTVAWTSAEDLLPWCMTVARNHLTDMHRRQARLGEVPDDLVDRADVHSEVAAKLSLRAIVGVWHQLSPRDRESLAEAASPATPVIPASRKEAVRENVARHRARQRLHALVAASLGIITAAGRLFRPRGLTAVATTAVAMTTLLVLPSFHQGAPTPAEGFTGRATPVTTSAGFSLRVATPVRVATRLGSRTGSTPPRHRPSVPLSVTSVHVGPLVGVAVTTHDNPAPSPLGSLCVGDLPVTGTVCVDTARLGAVNGALPERFRADLQAS